MRSQLRKSITTLVFAVCSGLVAGAFAQVAPSEIKPGAPGRYVVVPGDTLWSIAERYLAAPQRWPSLWKMNQETLKNPHRIYPGDVLVLDRANGTLALSSDTVKLSPRVRAEQQKAKEIPSIPPNLIEPYLSRPLVIEPDGLENAPTIIGTEDNRVILGAGNVAYVSGIGNSSEETWYIYRRGKALVDPETKSTLGYEATFLGSARVRVKGDPATVDIVAANQEIGKGDKLVAAGKPYTPNYAPHAPTASIHGQVISIYGGVGTVGEGGRNSVVTINRGKSNGLEVGHVLALLRKGGLVSTKTRDRLPLIGESQAPSAGAVKVPDERYGLVFVFRVFDRVSYGLVMHVSRPVLPLDVVQTP